MKKIKFVLQVICLIVAAEIMLPFIIVQWAINGKLIEMSKRFIKAVENEQRNS